MYDVANSITCSPSGNTGTIDRAREIDNWNVETAASEASRHGIDISEDHLDVLHFLRDYYVAHGWPKRPHELTRLLDRTYKHLGGKKYLHRLFPNGPLTQGAVLAGLPALYNVVDRSFGTAH